MSLTAVDAARCLAHALERSLQAIPDARRGDAERALRRLQDVVLPRLEDADAPVLVVVGGSTGSGKSSGRRAPDDPSPRADLLTAGT